ncbi:hypothetical protein D3C72_687860 [compost metagenome]
MLMCWSWMGLVSLAALAGGCAQGPESPRLDVPAYHLQSATLDWNGHAQPDPPARRARPVWTGGRTTGGWGQHYPWRGPGEKPAWYGVHAHAAGSVVLVGSYYYPYYFEGGKIFPVYSMPYALEGHRFVPVYGPLPDFGPYVLETTRARRVKHDQWVIVRG